jgi:hypothetical protein
MFWQVQNFSRLSVPYQLWEDSIHPYLYSLIRPRYLSIKYATDLSPATGFYSIDLTLLQKAIASVKRNAIGVKTTPDLSTATCAPNRSLL